MLIITVIYIYICMFVSQIFSKLCSSLRLHHQSKMDGCVVECAHILYCLHQIISFLISFDFTFNSIQADISHVLSIYIISSSLLVTINGRYLSLYTCKEEPKKKKTFCILLILSQLSFLSWHARSVTDMFTINSNNRTENN